MIIKKQIGCSYFGNRYIEHFKQDLTELQSGGFNTILLTYSENDYFFYSNTIKKMVKLAKQENFTVYIDPWGWGGIFGGEAFSKLVMEYENIKQINQKGEKVPALCINNNKTLKLLFEWIISAVSFDADYIFWDEPHFYFQDFKKVHSDFGCFCSVCSALYQKMFNEKLSIENYNKSNFYKFKSISILNFLNTVFSEVKKHNKKNALCVLPGKENEKGGLFDWNKIPELQNLDLIGTDPYWLRVNKTPDYVFEYANKINKLAKQNKLKSEIWIQFYKLEKKDFKEHDFVVNELLNNQKFDFDSIMFWSYKAGYPMSFLQSDDYEKYWFNVKNSVLKHI